MKVVKSRLFLGTLSLVVGLAVAFVLAPMYQVSQTRTGVVVKAKEDIKKGERITSDMLAEVEVGMQGQSNALLMTIDDADGRYAAYDFVAGDFVTANKIAEHPINNDVYLLDLNNGEAAMSIALTDARSVSSKLREGDIIQIVGVNRENNDTGVIYPELMAIEVLAVTDKELEDIEKNQREEIKLITVKAVHLLQIAKLAELENAGTAHAAIVYRGTDEKIRRDLLELQLEKLQKLEKLEKSDEKNEEHRENDTDKTDFHGESGKEGGNRD